VLKLAFLLEYGSELLFEKSKDRDAFEKPCFESVGRDGGSDVVVFSDEVLADRRLA
jgi:hypothetical protein